MACHIPGHLNVAADKLSRTIPFSHLEWSLNRKVIYALWHRWGTPDLDLFATWVNKKCRDYISPIPDPSAYSVDAFQSSWEDKFLYAFPPFRLLAKVLYKFRNEGSSMILIAPNSTEYEWYPQMLHLLADRPLYLPNWDNLLTQEGESSCNVHHLHAWLLTTEVRQIKRFRHTLPNESCYSRYGYLDGKSIQGHPLF